MRSRAWIPAPCRCVIVVAAFAAAACAPPATAPPDPAASVVVPAGSIRLTLAHDEGRPTGAAVAVAAFRMDAHEVTVAQFEQFVRATAYVTEAERFGWSGVFDPASRAWTKRDGATWRTPAGPGSKAPATHPVTQVSWNDAVAYAAWAGKRLPMGAEWELAARGGLADKVYPWGDDLRPGGKPAANWWQGGFPARDTGEDGFTGIAPVGSFAPNGYGLYDISGNVWEWTADRAPTGDPGERMMRGGSWMCAENFCSNYRIAGRSHATPDTGLNNLGFRCVAPLEP